MGSITHFFKATTVAGLAATAFALAIAQPSVAAPGDPDRSFGQNGIVMTSPDGPRDTVLRDFISLPDGKMLAAGGSGAGQNGVLVRYLPDGELDTTFDGDGIVLTPDSLWSSLIAQDDGKILAFGRRGADPAIARFETSGALDSAFADEGYSAPPLRPMFGDPEKLIEFRGLGVDTAGNITAAAIPGGCLAFEPDPANSDRTPWGDGPCPNVAVYRVLPGGDPDPAVGGGNGFRILSAVGPAFDGPSGEPALPDGIGMGPDGSFVVRSGKTVIDWDESEHHYVMVQRFTSGGEPVTGFGKQGRVEYKDVGPVEGGQIVFGTDGSFTLIGAEPIRFLPDGRRDGSFGTKGRVKIGLFPYTSDFAFSRPARSTTAADGTPVLAGMGYVGKKRAPYAIRLDQAGKPDATFAVDGLARRIVGRGVTTRQYRSTPGLDTAIPVTGTDGSITVATTGSVNGRLQFALIRFEGGAGKRMFCDGEPATVQGTPGDDVLVAGEVTATGAGDDRVQRVGRKTCTGAGNDVVKSNSTGGMLSTGGGADRIDASVSSLSAGGGRDRIATSGWRSAIDGGAGNDVIRIEGRDNVVTGGPGDDLIVNDDERNGSRYFGGAGSDRIEGAAGVELFDGGPGRDLLLGGPGVDEMFGRAGADRLFGGRGSDILIGGPGRDILEAGPKGPRLRIYAADNDKVKGQVKVLRNKAIASDLRFWTKCRGDIDDRFFGDSMFDDLKFDRKTGRFDTDYDFFDGFGYSAYGSMAGRVTDRAIIVRDYDDNEDFSYGTDGSFNCQTKNLKFRLPRQPDQVQYVRQGGR